MQFLFFKFVQSIQTVLNLRVILCCRALHLPNGNEPVPFLYWVISMSADSYLYINLVQPDRFFIGRETDFKSKLELLHLLIIDKKVFFLENDRIGQD